MNYRISVGAFLLSFSFSSARIGCLCIKITDLTLGFSSIESVLLFIEMRSAPTRTPVSLKIVLIISFFIISLDAARPLRFLRRVDNF